LFRRFQHGYIVNPVADYRVKPRCKICCGGKSGAAI
jgi:hypothetical protein